VAEYIPGTPIEEPGEYTLTVTAEDEAGNTTTFEIDITILKQWYRAIKLATPSDTKKVKKATLKIEAIDFEGEVHVTDIMLQGGNILTGWRPNMEDST